MHGDQPSPDFKIGDITNGNNAGLPIKLKAKEILLFGYSAESVTYSKKTNAAYLGKRCTIHQGDVAALPYPDRTLDYVTAFETVYFWPDLDAAFREIRRVLKPNGVLLICCESDDAGDTTWTDRIEGMTIHRGEDLKERLLKMGCQKAELHRNEKGWICLTAIC